MVNAILDPTGRAGATRTSSLAPRPDSLAGRTIGLIENTKQNAALLLDELGRLIRTEHGAAQVQLHTKTNFALPVPDDLLKQLNETCDGVITGVGDCGSCSASAVADGIAFENAGTPAAVICSDAFTVTADAMADLQGAPGYAYLTTAHPVAILARDEVRARARALLPDVVAKLTAGAE